MTDDTIARIERATLDAVAPTRVETLGHWLLPFDHSTIGRATSAVPLRHEGLDPADIAAIARRYRAQGLAAQFRIADTPALHGLHAALEAEHLAPCRPTLVQVGRISDLLALHSHWEATLERRPSPQWGQVYTASGFDAVDGAHRREALSRSPCVVYAHVHQNEVPLAAGTASISQGWAGIHGMRTVPAARGQGLARAILVALARHAQAQGVVSVFLQVEQNNLPAQSLYRRAGFATAWRYLYWQ